FQVESSGFQDFMTKLKPSTFEDIIALLAIYRPGPLGSGMVEDFIERRHGRREIVYELESLAPILKPTYGVIVYQEQVMQIASVLANFTLGDADLLRRAMGKKKPEEMARQKEKFLQGARENKIPEAKAKKIFDLMAKFAEYGFNKSHSAAYALVSYYTAYLKTHYTVEYMASLLTHEMGNTDKILIYIQDCREHGLEVLPPDLNESFRYFSVTPKGRIRFGLAGVKGVGEAAITAIIEERKKSGPFKTFFEFCERVDLRRVNKKVIESLIKCGALDSIYSNRASLLDSLDEALRWGSSRRKEVALGQRSMFELLSREEAEPKLSSISPMSESEKLKYEKEVLGFYISGHPLKPYQAQIKGLATHDSASLKTLGQKQEVSLCGVVSSLKEIRTKRGKRMAFINLEDLQGNTEVVIFNELFEKIEALLLAEEPLYFKGQAEVSEDGVVKVLGEEVLRLEDLKKLKTRSIHLRAEKSLLSEGALNQLKELVERHAGTLPIYLHLIEAKKEKAVLKLPIDLQVDLNEAFIQEVEALLGQHSLVLM
ncbi:MAG: DNA polymerase III subunit alpha, partial [Deltaproteobacteria bacterium]|nr:DNA polymerase III subunit alpha [Deltaproteobacteria bacterium]